MPTLDATEVPELRARAERARNNQKAIAICRSNGCDWKSAIVSSDQADAAGKLHALNTGHVVTRYAVIPVETFRPMRRTRLDERL